MFKQKFFKAIISIAMATSLLTMPIVSYAETYEIRDTDMVVIDEDFARLYGNAWAEIMYENKVSISEVVKVVDSNCEIAAFEVCFVDESFEPSGYMVVSTDVTLPDPLVEFSLRGDDIYSQLINSDTETASLYENRANDLKLLYSDTLLDYHVIGESYDGVMTCLDDDIPEIQTLSLDDVSLPSPQSANFDLVMIMDGLMEGTAIKGTAVSKKNLIGTDNFYPYTAIYLERLVGVSSPTGKNCGPTALLNAMYIFDCVGKKNLIINNDCKYTYSYIASLSGYDGTSGLSDDEITSTFCEYVDAQGYSASIDNYWLDSWSDFTRDIEKNCPIFVHIEGYTDEGKKKGHVVVAYGYLTKKLNTITTKYLKVADGMSSTGNRYLNYDYYDVVNGYCAIIE